MAALPVDIAVCAAAVADWRIDTPALQKRKKVPGEPPPTLTFVPNPDILATLAAPGTHRPRLIVGFAAETESVVDHARDKLHRKGCDVIVANDVSAKKGTFGGDSNQVHLVTPQGVEDWPLLNKTEVAERLVEHITLWLSTNQKENA